MRTGHLRGARSGIRKAGRRRRRTHSSSGAGVILTTSPGAQKRYCPMRRCGIRSALCRHQRKVRFP
ncbi:hypothetical protein ACFTXM_11710 [Streptomyces sp. NPDC056930]|uniref:hypothetical protein n=1 Tax=Streptomyces sp. NPDC056930 TaxID=3345967 RepID=UPI003645C8A2